MKGVSMPSRTYNILAAGKPILAIAEPGSETDIVVMENDIGRTVSPGDKTALLEAIHSLAARSPSELAAMGRRAREAAEREYSLETAIETYREAID
jgi:colanic acid biosynthesis glycosyl transferase WcaI